MVKNGHEKDDVIGLHVENIDTVLGTIVSTDGHVITQSERFFKNLNFLFIWFLIRLLPLDYDFET